MIFPIFIQTAKADFNQLPQENCYPARLNLLTALFRVERENGLLESSGRAEMPTNITSHCTNTMRQVACLHYNC